jgi:hypothetical protein
MAPELALANLSNLPENQVVLDPMAGSGTVLRQASSLGHQALGFDMDPLAVLMSRVWTTAVDDAAIGTLFDQVVADAKKPGPVKLTWMDDDVETATFAKYWFDEPQRQALRHLAAALERYAAAARTSDETASVEVLKLALSRLIITKDKGASLARDVSHSRPHKVIETNTYDVDVGYQRSVRALRKRLGDEPPGTGTAAVSLGDARSLDGLKDGSVDLVLTSPPYLNAIDYMRGHRLSLIWLGHRLADLRSIRSNSIGSERGADAVGDADEFETMKNAMGQVDLLPARFAGMIDRYVQDLYRMIRELARVIKVGGRATLVVGNSCLRGVFIKNAGAVEAGAKLLGFKLESAVERDLPQQSRYLPITGDGALGKRMRTEAILSFTRQAA